MREIRFKAKRLNDDVWVEGDLVHIGNRVCIGGDHIKGGINDVDPSTVCQYTGLKDKNGKEIWEHDVISIFSDREPCEVVFEKGCFIAINSKGEHTSLQKGIDYYDWDLKIIGNKFDRKEEK